MLAVNFIEFRDHPQRIGQCVRYLSVRVFHRRFRQIRLQHTGLSFSPPTMFLVTRFVLAPKVVTNLSPPSIALNDCNATRPIVLWGIGRLAVPLLGDRRLLITLDATGLFIETFATNPYRDSLALLRRYNQIGQITKIATSRFVRTITSRSDRDFLQYGRRLSLIGVTAEYFKLREKNRGGKPRNERHRF